MRAPDFWQHDDWRARALSPLAALWTWAGRRRMERAEEYRPAVPVVCIGNVVAGGAGKTPVAIALAERLAQRGRHPHFLSRGYGGTEVGPRAVDPARHDAARVGDEPLLLAQHFPTWVARWRPDGAAAAAAMGADIVVMDDGFQNPSLAKDVSLLVVDGETGFGNGRVIPAGPCREPVADALARADALVVMGEDKAGIAALAGPVPVLRARLEPGPEAADFAGRDVAAFAGIGRPAKFFRTLESCGARLVRAQSFPDHHPFTRAEIKGLLETDAIPVTTAKDWVRIPADLRAKVRVLTVRLVWEDMGALDALLDIVDTRK